MFANTAVPIVSAASIWPPLRRDYYGRLKAAESLRVKVVHYVVLAVIVRIQYIRG